MRAAVFAALLTFLLAACKSKEAPAPQPAADAPPLRSFVDMGDRQAAAQLLSGFHAIENNAWRWTERQFTVQLATPRPAPDGAVLALKLTVPPAVIQAVQTVTLSGSVQGAELAPEKYDTAGAYTYQRDVAPNLLTSDSVRVTFRLDKFLTPGGGDLRELGIIVQGVGLTAK